MLEQIRDRYGKGYITKEQLERYVKHGVITSGQAEAVSYKHLDVYKRQPQGR